MSLKHESQFVETPFMLYVAGKERRSMFLLKSHVMPLLYWHGLLKGWWEGPAFLRRLLSLGLRWSVRSSVRSSVSEKIVICCQTWAFFYFGHQGDHDSYFVSVILFKVQQWTFIIYDIYTKTYITYYFVLILFDDDRRRDSAINATSCLGHSDSVELQYWWYTVHSSK